MDGWTWPKEQSVRFSWHSESRSGFRVLGSRNFSKRILYTGYFFRAISFFVSLSAKLRENGWTDLHDIFKEGVEGHGMIWLNFRSIRVNGSAGQRSVCLLSPAIAQRTGVNKSVSFARWQQGAGFVVPRTTACYYCDSDRQPRIKYGNPRRRCALYRMLSACSYLRQVNEVNGGDSVFVWCVYVCVSVRSGPVSHISFKRLT